MKSSKSRPSSFLWRTILSLDTAKSLISSTLKDIRGCQVIVSTFKHFKEEAENYRKYCYNIGPILMNENNVYYFTIKYAGRLKDLVKINTSELEDVFLKLNIPGNLYTAKDYRKLKKNISALNNQLLGTSNKDQASLQELNNELSTSNKKLKEELSSLEKQNKDLYITYLKTKIDLQHEFSQDLNEVLNITRKYNKFLLQELKNVDNNLSLEKAYNLFEIKEPFKLKLPDVIEKRQKLEEQYCAKKISQMVNNNYYYSVLHEFQPVDDAIRARLNAYCSLLSLAIDNK